MDTSKWTLKTQEGFQQAIALAEKAVNPEVTREHLVLALLSQTEGITLPVLQKLGISPKQLKNSIE